MAARLELDKKTGQFISNGATKRTKICKKCHKIFYCPYGIGIGVWNKRAFCSSKCSELSQRKRIKKNCLFCKKEFETTYNRIKHCSIKCSNANPDNKKRRKGQEHPNFNRVTVRCIICNQDIETILSRSKHNRVCSKECYRELISIANSGENCHFWAGGIANEEYGPTFNRRLKREVRNRDNKCTLCQRTSLDVGYNLIVHHIDYNKKNNSLNNLAAVCRNCHSKTNVNRDYWKNYFNQFIQNTYGSFK